jgi:glycosyltransferase involved in cell wall biosynthesis
LPNPIRILHLIKSLGRGGAEKLIPETASVHDQTRFEFHCLYFYHQENNIVDELEAAGIKVHLIPSSNLGLFFQIGKVREFVKEFKIDIIHAHLPWAGILSRLAGRKLNVPIVYTEHNTWDRYNTISYWGNRLTFKWQDVAIAVSNEVALSMQLNSIFDPYRRGGRLKVRVIQNGVNTEVFRRETEDGRRKTEDGTSLRAEERSEAISSNGIETEDRRRKTEELRTKNQEARDKRQEIDASDSHRLEILPIPNPQSPNPQSLKERLSIPSNAPVIGKVAVFRSQKRLWIWVDIALKILEQCPETHFLLVGDGEWRERILDQIRDSGKGEHFHWVGVQKQVIPYLSIMDIYLSTSEFEGLPIAMLEAMSCEVPVVATRAGGIGEMVQHGVQGFLTEIEDYEDLVNYTVQLIRDPELHARFAAAARERVVEQFSMKRMVRELEEVYDSVSGEKGLGIREKGKRDRRKIGER